jgi:pectate disaccharide-lyase
VAGSHSEAIGNRVHDLAIPCAGDGGAGIDLSGSEVGRDQAAIRNLVTNIGSGPLDGGCRIIAGIYASVPGVRVLVNVVARAVGDGITSYHRATGLVIANNTSVDNGGNGILVGGSVPPFNRDSTVVNNIAAYNALGGIVECCMASPPSGGDFLNNLTFGDHGPDGPALDSPATRLSGTLHLNPRLTDAAAGDYQPRRGSPAFSSGTSFAAPPFDFDGIVRPLHAAFSRGAFSPWRR